ncbi:MAG: hypothetical protein ACFE9M_03960, partial [Promethearchaeota archaeon]
MKKIILDFEIRTENLKELIQEALNRNILNVLVSQETFREFEKIERLTIYSKNPNVPAKCLVYNNKELLEENLVNRKFTN